LKVVQIIYSGLGGHGSVAFSLISADKTGSWCPILGFFGVEPPTESYVHFCREKAIPFAYFGVSGGKSWKGWPRIFRWLRASNPDAVILHSVTALLPCLIFARLRRARLVVVEHQDNALKNRSEWLFSRLSMLFADRVVVLTSGYDQELKERIGLFYRASKVRLIPNGVDISRFKPQSGKPDKLMAVHLGMAARFTRIKRHDVLIEMLEELRRKQPEINWRLSMPGAGDTWCELNARVNQEGLNSVIALPGHLNEDQLIDWYQSLDVYVHASEGETLSTAILQAMATALPIVASDVPGIRSLISGQTKCGLLVGGQQPGGFAEAVIQLAKDAGLRSSFGEAGRQLAEKDYSQNHMFALYNNLLVNNA